MIKRRWMVERIFSWFGRNRRLAKDYENEVVPGNLDRWFRWVRPRGRTDPMTGKRKRYSAEFKAKVALEALHAVCNSYGRPLILLLSEGR